MKKLSCLSLYLILSLFGFAKQDSAYYKGDDKRIHYTGRIDYSEKNAPKYWSSGAYLQLKFKGTYCVLLIEDQVRWGKIHNYVEIIIDDSIVRRVQLKEVNNRLVVAENLPDGNHTLTLAKNTEAENGYIQVRGIICEQLLKPSKKKKRKIECIGDSITCGAASDESEIPCGKGDWHDQHNAWLAYGPRAARTLNAQWHLSSVSGIGLIHSCCNKKIVMPEVYDKINIPGDSLDWNFKNYQPDVVTICLGQNDGIQDSTAFCGAYVEFAKRLRSYYPKATLVFLTSPMASPELKKVLVNYTTAVRDYFLQQGDKRVGSYAFKGHYTNGCGSHPSTEEHGEIAKELSAYLQQRMKWK